MNRKRLEQTRPHMQWLPAPQEPPTTIPAPLQAAGGEDGIDAVATRAGFQANLIIAPLAASLWERDACGQQREGQNPTW